MLRKNLSKFVALVAIAAVMMPTMAFAHGGSRSGDDNKKDDRGRVENRNNVNEFGVHIFGERSDKKDKKKFHGWGSFVPNMFYSGTVTAKSGDDLTIDSKGSTYTVDTSSASLIQVPRTEIDFDDIKIGDKVHVTGKLTGVVIDASVVYNMPQNLKPAAAKGTITAVSNDTITVQAKGGTQELTVNTDSDTTIMNQDHEAVAMGEIEVGQRIGILGLWDTAVNVLNAIKIKIWA